MLYAYSVRMRPPAAFKSIRFRGASLLLIAAAAGCAGPSTAPSQTLTSLSIRVPSDVFIVGTNAVLTAVATLSTGMTVTPTGTQWISDDVSPENVGSLN